MERGKFQEFSASSASHSRKFEQDSERRNFLKNCGLGRNSERNLPPNTEHSPVIFMGVPYVPAMLTLVSCGRCSSTLMSPAG